MDEKVFQYSVISYSELMNKIKIWVDGDACPKPIKEILYRAANRLNIVVTLVANTPLRVPESPYITTIVVPDGFDVADQEIVEQIQTGDLVITADIPLAAEVVKKEAFALNVRGEFYTESNIQERLAMRNLMDSLRNNGEISGGGPAPFNHKDRQAFSNQLDRFLTKAIKT